jgi:dihydroorotate dehydrogenase
VLCVDTVEIHRHTVYRLLIRPLVFRLDPERAHDLTLWLLKQAARVPFLPRLTAGCRSLAHPLLRTEVCGLRFPNPVGLAAGFDKSATAVAAFPALGFGFIEVGTVTPRPQGGNPLPRLFRVPADDAVINRMGFNNDGATAVAERLRAVRREVPIGVNLGKNADTRLDRAVDDYRLALEWLHDVGDYIVINVSSPNTPGLRDLQAAAELRELLSSVHACNQRLAHQQQRPPRPLFVKIAPDLGRRELDDVIEVVQGVPLDGIIATNSTLGRRGLSTGSTEAGGLSGRPLRQPSTEIVRYLYAGTRGRLPIVGVGGIFSAEDAYEKICAGASLVQLYTGLIYAGPTLPHHINRGLIRLLRRDGFAHVSEAVGCAL